LRREDQGRGIKRRKFVRKRGTMSGLSGSGDGAKRLGGKLLEEVEVEELTSVCYVNTTPHTTSPFESMTDSMNRCSNLSTNSKSRKMKGVFPSNYRHLIHYLQISTFLHLNQLHKRDYQTEWLLQHPTPRRYPPSRPAYSGARFPTTNTPSLQRRENIITLPHHRYRRPTRKFLQHQARRPRCSDRTLGPVELFQCLETQLCYARSPVLKT
jgi:hypothetical protein